jgi:hypothetical protein
VGRRSGQTRTWIANTRRRSWAQGQRVGDRASVSAASGVVGPGTMAARQRAREAVIGKQRPPRRRQQGGQAFEQLHGIEEERRGPVAPWAAELV